MPEIKQRGISQTEFITMIAVLSTLSAVALPQMTGVTEEAKRATMRHLGGTLTQASVLNAAEGELRGTARLVTTCQDAGQLIVNASMQEDRMLWEERVLVLADVAPPPATAVYHECVLADAQAPAVEPVKFFIRRCTDERCAPA